MPEILLISAVFFKEKMQKQDILVVCITMGGMVLFYVLSTIAVYRL